MTIKEKKLYIRALMKKRDSIILDIDEFAETYATIRTLIHIGMFKEEDYAETIDVLIALGKVALNTKMIIEEEISNVQKEIDSEEKALTVLRRIIAGGER